MLFNHNLDDHVYYRLLTLEDELHDVVEADPEAMKSFLERLSELQRIATQGITEKVLSTRTLALARSVASSGVVLADHYLKVRRANADVDKRRQAQLVSVFGRLSISDNSSTPSTCCDDLARRSTTKSATRTPSDQTHRSRSSRHSSPSGISSSGDGMTSASFSNSNDDHVPAHIPKAYAWLLKHLHNPYPSSAMKTKMSEETGSPVKSISEWFIYSRRKIGWTQIVKRLFKGDRSVAIDCARSVLLGELAKFPVSRQIIDAFLAMKDTAEKLFEGKFETSAVARHLGDLVKEVAVEHDPNPQPTMKAKPPATARPSGKRKIMDDSSSRTEEGECSRPTKRNRSLSSSVWLNEASTFRFTSAEPATSFPEASLPNPSVAPHRSIKSVNYPVLPILHPASSSSSRKRQLSHSDDDGPSMPKRLHGLPTTPHLQTISVPSLVMGDPYTAVNSVNCVDFDQIWSTLDFSVPAGVTFSGELPESDLDLTTPRVAELDMTDTNYLISSNPTAGKSSISQDQTSFVEAAGDDDFQQVMRLFTFSEDDLSTTRADTSSVNQPADSSDFAVDFGVLPAMPILLLDSTETTLSSTGLFSSPLDPFLPPLESFLPMPETGFSSDSTPLFDKLPPYCSSDLHFPLEVQVDSPTTPVSYTAFDSIPSLDFVQDSLHADKEAKAVRLSQVERGQWLGEKELKLQQKLILTQT